MIRHLAASGLVLLATGPVMAQTLERVAETGELRVGYRETAVPFSHVDATTGVPSGYTVALCAAIAEDIAAAAGIEDLRVDYVATTATARFDDVAEGRIDLLCGAATQTLARREVVDFSIPTFVDGAGLAVPRDGARSMRDLDGETIAVTAGTTTEEALRRMLDETGLAAEVLAVADHDAGLDALEDGSAAAYFADRAILQFLTAERGAADIGIVADQFTLETHALALPRGDSDFRLAVDRGLSRLYLTGAVDALFAEAFGPNAEMTELLRALYRVSALPR